MEPETTALAPPAKTSNVAELARKNNQASMLANLPASAELQRVRLDTARFELVQRRANAYCNSTLVPPHFQGNIANCVLAVTMGDRLKEDPFMIMQHSYVVHNKFGFMAQYLIAKINSAGRFKGPIRWREEGKKNTDAYTVFAYADPVDGTDRVEVGVSWQMVKAEGWESKAGSKWKTMPDMMFKYRSAAFFARLYCPDLIMGMKTVEEIEDYVDAEIIQEAPDAHTTALADRLTLPDAPAPAAEPESAQEAGEAHPPDAPDAETKAEAARQVQALKDADAAKGAEPEEAPDPMGSDESFDTPPPAAKK